MRSRWPSPIPRFQEGDVTIHVRDATSEDEFLQKANAIGATVRVLRTTSVAPTSVEGGVVLRPAISIQYSFDEHSEGGAVRWVFRERWVANESNEVDLSNALLTRMEQARQPQIVFTQRSGSV